MLYSPRPISSAGHCAATATGTSSVLPTALLRPVMAAHIPMQLARLAVTLLTLRSEAAMAVPVQKFGTVQLNPFDMTETTKPSLLPRRSFTERVSVPGRLIGVVASPVSWNSGMVTELTVIVIGEKKLLSAPVTVLVNTQVGTEHAEIVGIGLASGVP